MDDLDIKQTLERLEEQQRKIFEQLASNSIERPKRDFWDKLAALSPIISGVAIALSALLCTYQYNQQQIKLQEAQTVEKFIPHLMGNDTSKRMAILAMKTLVNTDLAAKYAAMFPSEGTLSALKTIAKNGDSRDKTIVSKTYHQIEADEKGDSISSDNELKTSDSTSPSPDVPFKIEHASPSVPTMEPDTAGDTAPHVPAEKEHHKEHLAPREHVNAAEERASREDTQPNREMETRQPLQLERIRSSAMKEEAATGL